MDVLNWVTGFVEKPMSELNGWPPCPHARRARLEGKFEIRQGRIDPYTDLRTTDMGEKLVITYVYDPKQFSADEFDHQIKLVNQGFLLPRNMIGLGDHPDSVENVRGVIMNQGSWALAFVQHLDKLNHFARLIAGRGYYEGWPEDYLASLFRDREDPRQQK